MRAMAPRPITLEAEPEPLATELGSRLRAWNDELMGPANRQRFTLSVRDDDGNVIAGLVGEQFWNVLYIEALWVTEEHRKNGFGSALLARAETIARQRPCEAVYLSTFTFQAPIFYEKCGYTRFGELPYGPQGSRRIWFAKRLP
jgi:GNAT superfamily N-acetyltransferase